MVGQGVGDITANAVDLRFQLVVEQIADHRHATAHPLPAPTEFRVIELRHRAVAVADGDQHMHRRVLRDSVSIGQVLNELLAGW